MTYTIELLGQRQFFLGWFWGIWGLEFFQCSGHHMVPISCKASYRILIYCPQNVAIVADL